MSSKSPGSEFYLYVNIALLVFLLLFIMLAVVVAHLDP